MASAVAPVETAWPCSASTAFYCDLEFKAVLVLESACQPPKRQALWLYSVALSQPDRTHVCALWAVVTQLPAQVQFKVAFSLIQVGKKCTEPSGNHTEVSRGDRVALKKRTAFL